MERGFRVSMSRLVAVTWMRCLGLTCGIQNNERFSRLLGESRQPCELCPVPFAQPQGTHRVLLNADAGRQEKLDEFCA